MSWKLNPDRPVYMQLIERITTDIIAGIYPPGSKLPSVRDLAQTAGVNPNTMQKALSEMERTNLVYSQRTSGRFITEDLNMIDNLKTELASEQITWALMEECSPIQERTRTLSGAIARWIVIPCSSSFASKGLLDGRS